MLAELEARRKFGMVCKTCGADVPDDAAIGWESI